MDRRAPSEKAETVVVTGRRGGRRRERGTLPPLRRTPARAFGDRKRHLPRDGEGGGEKNTRRASAGRKGKRMTLSLDHWRWVMAHHGRGRTKTGGSQDIGNPCIPSRQKVTDHSGMSRSRAKERTGESHRLRRRDGKHIRNAPHRKRGERGLHDGKKECSCSALPSSQPFRYDGYFFLGWFLLLVCLTTFFWFPSELPFLCF